MILSLKQSFPFEHIVLKWSSKCLNKLPWISLKKGAILPTPETLSRSVVTTKPLKLFNTNYSTLTFYTVKEYVWFFFILYKCKPNNYFLLICSSKTVIKIYELINYQLKNHQQVREAITWNRLELGTELTWNSIYTSDLSRDSKGNIINKKQSLRDF